MKVVTWNVNSVRARHDRLVAWVGANQPDVLCLQETKIETDLFPRASLEALGYQIAHVGQRSYNGVAIASRTPLSDVVAGMADGVDDPQARFLAATVRGVRVLSLYTPNGEAIGSDKYAYKLAWLGRLRAWLAAHADPATPVLLCGDFNVAPDDLDVHDPVAWAGAIHCSEPERAALRDVTGWGLIDTHRKHHPDGRLYSWWDYRGVSFFKDRGLRIDHIFATAPFADACRSCDIDREARKGQNASDHAPVVAVFDVP
jgi:exodeoxyribonuclease III